MVTKAMALLNRYRLICFILIGLGLLFAASYLGHVQAAGCTAPSPSYGTVTINSFTISQTGTYRVWTRMAQGSAGNNKFLLEIKGSDGSSNCFTPGGTTLPSTWASDSSNWVDYQNGNTSNKVNVNLATGVTYTIKLLGNQPDVEVDRLIFTTATSPGTACSPPVGKGDTCVNNSAPVISIQSPANGAHLSGNATLKASITDPDGNLLTNSIVFQDGTTSLSKPTSLGGGVYQLTWDTSNVAAGAHTLNFKASDNLAASTTESVNVTVDDNASVALNGLTNGDVMTGANKTVSALVSGTTTASKVDFIITGPSSKTITDSSSPYCLSGTGATCQTFDSTTLNNGDYSLVARVTYTRAGATLTKESAAVSFTVNNGPPDTQPTNPQNLTKTGQTTTTVNLAWDSSLDDNPPLRGYIVYRNGSPTPTSATTTTPSTSTTAFTDTGLDCNVPYNYKVQAVDSIGQTSPGFSNILSVTIPCPDITPPSVPQNVSATATAHNNVNLSWNASTDIDDAVSKYYVLRSDGQTFTVTAPATSYSDSTVIANTTYQYCIKAEDTHHNVSNCSSFASVTTPDVPDTTPPSDPSGAHVTIISQNSVTICWNPSVDTGAGLANYKIYRDGSLKATLSPTLSPPCFTDATLAAYTTYHYQVQACDAASTPNCTHKLPETPTNGLQTHTLACGIGNFNCNTRVVGGRTVDIVDQVDVSSVIGNWSGINPRPDLHADFNGDLLVDQIDISTTIGHWNP